MRAGPALIALGLVMVGFDLGVAPRFSVQLTDSFRLQFGAIFVVLGGLTIVLGRLAEQRVTLTSAELARWAGPLELATPRIIALCEAHYATAHVAEVVAREAAIPEDVVLRYLYAMREHLAAPTIRANRRRDPLRDQDLRAPPSE